MNLFFFQNEKNSITSKYIKKIDFSLDSNLGWAFHFMLMPLEKAWIDQFLPAVSREDWDL